MEDIYNKVEEFNGFDDIIGAYDGEWHRQEVMRTVMEEKVEQGIKQGIEHTAKNMLKENIDINIISKVTGLSIDEIQNL